MKLLVQGDDFGFTKGVIFGIVDAIDNGILRNTGLFANSPYARLASSFMEERRDKVCFGIDFNLVSGPSLLKKEDIPHLIDENGIFIRSGVRMKDELYKTEEGRNLLFPYDEVYKELRAQYDAFVSLTHHKPGYLAPHSLGAENYFKAMQAISEETGVPLAMELQKKYHFANLFMKLMQERGDKASKSKTFDAKDQLNKNPKQDVIDNWDYLMSFEYATIGQHPGFLDAELLEQSSLSIERVKDHEMMTSSEIKQLIKDNSVELINYYDLY